VASGCIVKYEGKRGTVWRISWRDATGHQTMETLGKAADGWTEKKAKVELRNRLSDIDRNGYRAPEPVTFAAFAERFKSEYLPGRNLKPSTLVDYELTLRRHLVPHFGALKLAAIEPAHVDAYVTTKTKTLSSKTVTNHLALLGVMLKVAKRWRLVSTNVVEDVDRPRFDSPEMNVLSEAEIAGLLTAYRELELDPPTGTLPAWWAIVGRLITLALTTALRRGELLALHWRDVELLEGKLTVREAFVRGQFQAPKSKASRRTIELGPRALRVLQEQWAATSYKGDDELVFGHPEKGTPLDPSKLGRDYLRPALKRAKITKPFRVWHDMRHTALTHEAAAGNPAIYVQLKAGHSQGSITERYLHAAQVLFPRRRGQGRGADVRRATARRRSRKRSAGCRRLSRAASPKPGHARRPRRRGGRCGSAQALPGARPR
jgi:integrase